ncbi:hypothetical protein RJ498_001762 [Pluralibacter gergoviae]
MRELKNSELENVSGAGFFIDAGMAMGRSIGAIVDATGGKGGVETGTTIGKSVGEIIESGLGLLSSVFGGLFGKK